MRCEEVLKYFNENTEFMKNTVKTNIEINRKGTVKIILNMRNLSSARNVTIKVKQKTHEFKYGANLFMLDEFETEEKNEVYRKCFREVNNIATLPFYWSDLEPEQGKHRYEITSPKIYRRPAIDLCMDYCEENDIEAKCHCLNYDNVAPAWVRDTEVLIHKQLLKKRFYELAERYSTRIPSWEVTNETFNVNQHYETKFYSENDFVEWSFETARECFPKNRLIINDYAVFERDFRGNRSQYYMQVERLLKKNSILLDSIGMQFHCFCGLDQESELAKTRYNPVYLYKVFDKYAELGKKLQITEMTIPAFSSTEIDEDIQAELARNLYTVFFSHPAMEAIIYWNLVDGYAAKAPQGDMTAGENKFYGGMLRFDMTKKKIYHTIKDLFEKEWHTEIDGLLDYKGEFEFRGYYGSYDVEIFIGNRIIKKEIFLSAQQSNIFEIEV